jgi:hypothetical protein
MLTRYNEWNKKYAYREGGSSSRMSDYEQKNSKPNECFLEGRCIV